MTLQLVELESLGIGSEIFEDFAHRTVLLGAFLDFLMLLCLLCVGSLARLRR